jgi:hypothetical protein
MNFTKALLRTAFLKLRNRFLLYIIIVVAVAVACSKVDNNSFILTKNNNPSNLQHSDTATVQLQTFTNAGAFTNNLTADQLGAFYDPVFGRTVASINTQIVPLNSMVPGFDTSTVVDSFILALKVTDMTIVTSTTAAITGNTSDVQTLRVFKITDQLIANKTYPSDSVIHYGDSVGTYTGSFSGMMRKDSTLRIHLSKDFAKEFVTQFKTNSAIYYDLTTFLTSFLPGIAIIPDSSYSGNGPHGATLPFDLNNTNSRATIFYHNGKNAPSNRFDLVMNSGVRVNRYTHQYAGTEAGSHINNPSAGNKAYLQGLGGLKVKMTLPYLKEYAKLGLIGLQQAELVFPKADSTGDLQSMEPNFLLIRPRTINGTDCLGQCGFTDDQMAYYGGTWNSSEKSYHFIITKYVQSLLYNMQHNPAFVDYGMNLSIPADNPNTLSRIILGNYQNANPKFRPKLILTFTKIGG